MNLTDFGVGSDVALPAQITLTGINDLFISSLEAVADPSAANGSMDFSTWHGLNQINITASAGTDNVTASATTAVSVADSAGNIRVHGGASVAAMTDATSSIAIDGGAATASVTLTGGGSVAAGNGGNVVTDLNFGTAGGNTIASATLTNSGATTINSDALTSLSLAGSGNDVTVNAAAGARTLAVALNSVTAAMLTDNTASTLHIAANGSDTIINTIGIAAHSAAAIGFDDSASLHLSSLAAPMATSITIVGNGAFSGDFSQVNSAANIDASGAAGANSIDITLGTGANGMVTLGAHTASDQITIGAMAVGGAAPDLAHILTISGFNKGGADSIVFADAANITGAILQQITSAQVSAAGASTATLAGWVAAATGLGGTVAQSAHGVLEFEFGGNTYLIETATANDGGTLGAHDAMVALVGTGYVDAHASALTAGVVHLVP
jgi:hypothetical protein